MLVGRYPRVSSQVTGEGGPSAVNVRPLPLCCFKPSDLPRLRTLVRPFQNKVLPTGFHSLSSFHPKMLASEPRGSLHIPGLHEDLPPLPLAPHGVWALRPFCSSHNCSWWLRCDAAELHNSFWVTRPSYYYFGAPTLILRRVSPGSRGYCKKRCARCIATSTNPTGKWSPSGWLNLSSSLMIDSRSPVE